MDSTNIKYAGEAIFLVGVAYRLLRWALGAFVEGDAPPSAFNANDPGAPASLGALLTTPMSELPGATTTDPKSGVTSSITFRSTSPSLVAKFTNSMTQADGLGEVTGLMDRATLKLLLLECPLKSNAHTGMHLGQDDAVLG